MKFALCLLAPAIALLGGISTPAAATAVTPDQSAAAGCASGAFCAFTAPNYTGSEYVFFTCGTRTTTLTSTGSWIANEPAGDKVVFHFRNGTSRTYQTPARVASLDWSSVLSFQIVC